MTLQPPMTDSEGSSGGQKKQLATFEYIASLYEQWSNRYAEDSEERGRYEQLADNEYRFISAIRRDQTNAR